MSSPLVSHPESSAGPPTGPYQKFYDATPREYAFGLDGTISLMPAFIPVAWRFEREVLGQPNPPGQAVAGFARSLLDGVYRIPSHVLHAPPSPSKTMVKRTKKISCRPPTLKRKSRDVKAAILQPPPAAATQARAGASPALRVAESPDAEPRKLTRRQRKAEVVRGIFARRAAERALRVRLGRGPMA